MQGTHDNSSNPPAKVDDDLPFSLTDYTQSTVGYMRPGDQYQAGNDGLQVLTYDDINHVGFRDLSRTQCDSMIMIHDLIRANWISPTTGRKYGPNLIKLGSRDIITPLEDVTPQCVFDFYSMLTNQLPNLNVAIVPFRAIMFKLGKHGLCPPGMGHSRYLEMSRALYNCLQSNILPTGATRLNSVARMVGNSSGNGYDLLRNILVLTLPVFDPMIRAHFPHWEDQDRCVYKFADASLLYF